MKKDLLRQDSLEHSEVTQLVTVARGQSILTSKSVTVSGLISFEGSVSAELKQAIAAKTKMNANLGWTATTEVSTEFRFPDGMPGDYAVFYMAIAYDYYGFTYHRYDHYIGNGAGGGLGVGNIVKDAGEITFYAHIPYDITYPRTFFA